MARIFLRKGANVEIMGSNGHTTASYLFGSSRPRIPQTEFVDILAYNSFTQFNTQDKDGWTVLHKAAAWGTAADVRKLLQLNTSPHCRTHKLGWTPILCAMCNKNLETFQELWGSYDGLNPEDEQDIRGWNLLHIAAEYGNFEAVPYLLEQGVKLEALSESASKFVPLAIQGKCVSPTEVARSCGKEAYVQWCSALEMAGREADRSPDEIDWAFEYVGGRLGECECCDHWGSSPSDD
jgi:hypothetical protein